MTNFWSDWRHILILFDLLFTSLFYILNPLLTRMDATCCNFLLIKYYWMHSKVLWNASVHDADSVWLRGAGVKAPKPSRVYQPRCTCSVFVPSFMWKHSFAQHSAKHTHSRVSWLSVKECRFYTDFTKDRTLTPANTWFIALRWIQAQNETHLWWI